MEPSNASMQSRVGGIGRALEWLAAPAIRVMDRMRFGRRVALLGAVGMLATVVTLVFFVPMLGRDVAFVRSEQAGVQAVPALVELVAQMQRHRGNVNRLLKGDATAKPAVDKAAAGAAAASAQLDAVFADAARGLDLGAQWQALRDGWSALARDSEALTPAESFTRHSERIHQALDLLEAVSRRSGLMLDPELASWALADSVTRRLPAYMELIGVMRGSGAGALAAGDTSSATREAVRTTRGIAEYVYDDKRAAFDETLKAAPEMAAIVAQAEQLGSLHAGYMATTQTQFAGTEPPSISAADYFAQGTALVDGAHAIVQAAVPQLQRLLAQRQGALERKRGIVLAVCVLSILLEVYCFLGFMRSVSVTLRRLSQASRLLAEGRFPEPIVLRSGDELQTIADETARVSATLQRFDAAQRALASCHAQGDTDARIDTAEFRGAYGEMAAALNAALEGHIQVQQRMTEVMAHYARGDLSVRIEDMPGRRAEISSAINQVRDRLEQVNRQILSLAEAAARGEFSVRGELDGLEFAYAEMVQGLNRLMRNAETGLGDLDRFMSALAAGDLRVRMQGDYAGMFAHLRDSAHQTAAQLSDLVGRIHGSADAIGLAAAEIGQGNAELSSRTERQAAALEETASSAATSSTAVHRTTAEAQRASTLASEARRCAESGGEVMLRTVATMRRLQDSSSKIHEIIGLIDGIAFQTNILALNAAVEAARAGEQGRGFAVVASEVRSLAQRCAAAARDIGQLIAHSVEEITEGSQMAEEAGSRMGEIVGSVNDVAEIMRSIADSSREQSGEIDQISGAIAQMDAGTQQNAALAEEASAAARSLESEVGTLVDMIRTFRLPAQAAAGRPATRAA